MDVNFLHRLSKKSLFRASDRFELAFSYVICFSLLTAFTFAQNRTTTTFILASYLKSFTNYQIEILTALSFLAVIFHYQMVNRKRVEVYCRILVGDTLTRIRLRYIFECLFILFSIYTIFEYTVKAFQINIGKTSHLITIFILYIAISSYFVRDHESI